MNAQKIKSPKEAHVQLAAHHTPPPHHPSPLLFSFSNEGFLHLLAKRTAYTIRDYPGEQILR
jgi:hypothetical protein